MRPPARREGEKRPELLVLKEIVGTNAVLNGLGGQKLLPTGFDLNLFGPKLKVPGSAFRVAILPSTLPAIH